MAVNSHIVTYHISKFPHSTALEWWIKRSHVTQTYESENRALKSQNICEHKYLSASTVTGTVTQGCLVVIELTCLCSRGASTDCSTYSSNICTAHLEGSDQDKTYTSKTKEGTDFKAPLIRQIKKKPNSLHSPLVQLNQPSRNGKGCQSAATQKGTSP